MEADSYESFCEKIDKRIRSKILPAPLIIENYVAGDSLCNYELYLLELINHSKWMRAKYQNQFVWQKRQDHGECDVYSGEYGLDFKLAAAKSKLQAIRELSEQIQLFAPGVYATSESRKQGKMKSTRLFAALRYLSVDELEIFAASTDKKRGLENDLATFLQSIGKKKNLLIFFPYRFFTDNDCGLDGRTFVDKVIDGLNHDFSAALSYREQMAPEYDTFFVTICNTDFLLMKYYGNTLFLVDIVPTKDCSTFAHLESYTDFWMY